MNTNVSVVVPALNEKANLKRLIPKLYDEDISSIFIIDDGSKDGTRDLIKDFPDVHFLFRRGKLGLISAELDGMRLSDSEYVVIMDADLSHRPEDINGMIEQAKRTKSDLVIGSRYIDRGITNDEFIRQILSKGANKLFHISFNVDIKDCTSGFRIYSRAACEFLVTQVDLENSYVGQVDILKRLNENNFKITEYPVNFVKRTEGKSKLEMKEIVNFFLFVLYNKRMLNYIFVSLLTIFIILIISYVTLTLI